MELLIEVITALIKRAIRGGLKHCLILILGFNVACASAPPPESFPVGSAPWEVQERDARIALLENQVRELADNINGMRDSLGKGLEAIIEVIQRQEKFNAVLFREEK